MQDEHTKSSYFVSIRKFSTYRSLKTIKAVSKSIKWKSGIQTGSY